MKDLSKLRHYLVASIVIIAINFCISCRPTNAASVCASLDSIISQRNHGFQNIRGEAYDTTTKGNVMYRSTVNLGAEPSQIVFRQKSQNWFYRGFYTVTTDSVAAQKLFQDVKSEIKSCLHDWESIEIIDADRKFPFTRFVRQNIQVQLWYMKEPDGTFTVGIVVEDWPKVQLR